MKNCCSDEEKSNTYRPSETNQGFETRGIKEDGSNAIHHGYDYREEGVSREEQDLESLPPKSVSSSDTRVNRRPYKETDNQQKTSLSVSYEVHGSSKGEEEQMLEKHPPNTLQGCEQGHKQSTNDNLLQQTSSYQGMYTDRHEELHRRRGPLNGNPQKFTDSSDHNDEFDLRQTDNTEFYNKSDLERDKLYSLESRPNNRQEDDPDEKFKEKYESKRNNETKKSDLERDNLYSLESRPNNRQVDDPDEENQEDHEQKTCIDTKKSNIESSNRYSKDHRGPQTSVDVQEEDFTEENIPASTNEIHQSNIENNNRYSIEPRGPQNSVDDQEEDLYEEHIPTRTNEMDTIEDSSEYCEPMEIENSSDDVQETVATSDFNSSSDWVDFEENIPDAFTKSNIEDCDV